MQDARINVPNLELLPPWDAVINLTEIIAPETWLLVGGLMVQAHAALAGHESRATRDRERHLEDTALLSSFVVDHSQVLEELHGSDKKRLKAIWTALENLNHPAWLKLDEADREKGHDTLRILSA